MLPNDILEIFREDAELLKIFEEWDRTGTDPFKERVVSLSIRETNYERLRKVAAKKKMSMSNVLDDIIEAYTVEYT